GIDHAGKVHHLGKAEHAATAQQALEVAAQKRPARRLERRRGNRRRRHEVEVERKPVARVEQPVHSIGAEHVRQLVRVEHDGGRPGRKDEPCELVGQELRRLEVHMGVDEAGHDVAARRVDDLAPVVLPEPGDPAVGDGDVGFEPLAREHGEHAAAAHDHVGWLVAAGDGEAAGGDVHPGEANTLRAVDVLTPRPLEEALRLKAERIEAVPIQGGTDVMVELNFDRVRPAALLNLNEVAELRGWSREDGRIRLGAGLTYTEAMEAPLPALVEASRTVGGPQIRNRGTIGGNLGTSSPAGDALPPLLVCNAEVRLASVRGERALPLQEFVTGVKRNALADDELILDVTVDADPARQTFMKVGPRNAMVISVVSLAVR